MKEKMDVKKALVFFLAIASIFSLTALVGAQPTITVEIDGIDVEQENVAVIAGETITLEIQFEADRNASDVRIEAEIEGDREDSEAQTSLFDVIDGRTYTRRLNIKVPFELEDETNDDLTLNIDIDELDVSESYDLTVQRPSYNVDVIAINADSKVNAGEMFQVEFVLRNRGYNDVEDLQVTVSIPELELERTTFVGDLVSIECCDEEGENCDECDDDETDTVIGKLYLRVPFDATTGTYSLKVEVSDRDVSASRTEEIAVENEFSEVAMKTDEGVLITNPTDSLKVYRVVTLDGERVVTVSPASSRTVEITPSSEDYVVTVLTSAGQVVREFTFQPSEGQQDETEGPSPVVVLTIISAIIFLVLLVVLIALITRRPKKSDEIGESYY